MLQYAIYQDPNPEYTQVFDSMGPEDSAFSFHSPVWTSLDPQFGSDSLYQELECFELERQQRLSTKTPAFAAYDRAAHGFGLTIPVTLPPQQQHQYMFKQQYQSPDDNLYHLGLTTSWHGHETDEYRNTRYVSPTDGGSLISCSSASDSAFSDYALSPDGMRGATAMASFAQPSSGDSSRWASPALVNGIVGGYTKTQQRYPSLVPSQYPYPQSHSRASTSSSSIQHSSLPPAPGLAGLGSPTACSMKELQLQYTPDSEEVVMFNDTDIDMMMMEDSEVIRIKVSEPEEVALREGRVFNEEVEGDCDGEDDLEDEGGDDADGETDAEVDKDNEDEKEDLDEGGAEGEFDYDTPLPDALSEVDPDFSPTSSRSTRNLARKPLRTSARTPKQTNYLQRMVRGENVRVHKPKSKSTPKSHTKSIARPKSKPNRKPKFHSSSKAITPKSPSSKPTTSGSSKSSSTKTLYPCPFHPFSCPSIFPSKNEWKRHTLSQHLQLGLYRCDLGACNEAHASGETRRRGFNEFNRRDLFVQHVRRMHIQDYEIEMGKGFGPGEVGAMGGGKAGGAVKTVTKGKESAKGKGSRMAKSSSSAAASGNTTEKEDFESWITHVRGRCWDKRRETPEWCVCGVCGKVFGDPPRGYYGGASGGEIGRGDGTDAHTPTHRHNTTTTTRGGGKAKLPLSISLTAQQQQEHKEVDAITIGRAWEEKMEHVARHYEREGVTVEQEGVDEGLRMWAVSEGLVRMVRGKGVLVGLGGGVEGDEEVDEGLMEEQGQGERRGRGTGQRGRGRGRGRRAGWYSLRGREQDEDENEDGSEESAESESDKDEDDGQGDMVTVPVDDDVDDIDTDTDTDAEGEPE